MSARPRGARLRQTDTASRTKRVDLSFDAPGRAASEAKLLRAALELFLQTGLPVTAADIAKQAGVAPNTFYRLFKARPGAGSDDPVARCFDSLFDDCWAKMNDALKNVDYVPREGRPFTPAEFILDEVEHLLRTHGDRTEPLRDAITYVMVTASRPLHLSDPMYASDEQAVFEDHWISLCSAAIDTTPSLAARWDDAFELANTLFTAVRTTVVTGWTDDADTIDDLLGRLRRLLEGEDLGGLGLGDGLPFLAPTASL